MATECNFRMYPKEIKKASSNNQLSSISKVNVQINDKSVSALIGSDMNVVRKGVGIK